MATTSIAEFLKKCPGYEEFAELICDYPDVQKAIKENDLSAFMKARDRHADVKAELDKLMGSFDPAQYVDPLRRTRRDFDSGGPNCSGSSLGSPSR